VQIVHHAANLADAHLLRQLLEDAGIPVYLNGEYLQGAIGELPANTPILLMVPDEHVEAARAIVVDWEQAAPEPVETAEQTAEESYSQSSPVSIGASRRMGPVFSFIGALLIGGLFGAGLVWTIYNRPGVPEEIDYDGDGRIDDRYSFAGDRVDRLESDRDRDGRVDQIYRYTAKGDIDRIESDDDFDGRYERVDQYRHGQPETTTIDSNHDGKHEQRTLWKNGVKSLDEWFDDSGRVVKALRYRDGQPWSSGLDTDGDGTFDVERAYDIYGEISYHQTSR